MKKRLFRLASLVIPTLLAALGFSACKSQDSVQSPTPGKKDIIKTDTIHTRKDTTVPPIRVVYGPPPTRFQEINEP